MASRPPVPPITNQFPIVDGGGRPTDYFIRWLQERGFQIDGMMSPEKVNELIDEWSATRTISAGAGLSGGGTLDADRSFALDAALGQLNDVDFTTPPTDGQVIVFDAATSTWKPADQSGGGGGGGGLALLDDIQVSVPTALITFAAIDQGYTNLKILAEAWGGSSGGDAQLYGRFNSDAGANYSGYLQNGFGSGSNSNELSFGLGSKPGGSSMNEIEIFDYSDAVATRKQQLFRSTVQQSPQFNQWGGGYWASAAAIAQIDMYRSDSGTFGAGSRFRLYGW